MSKPLCIDIFCGLGGFSAGFLIEGWECVGFDIERHIYGDEKYPAQLVLQDALTIHGKQFATADCIVASPPCTEFSYMSMPWSKAKEKQARIRADVNEQKRLTALFDACFRIQREACAAAGRHIPMVVENVKGAQPWVGQAKGRYGPYMLWGDVPALLPADVKEHTRKGAGSGAAWWRNNSMTSSKSSARKEWTAKVAKIPLPLSRYIARTFYPAREALEGQ